MEIRTEAADLDLALRGAVRACRSGDWWEGLARLEEIAGTYRHGTRFPGYFYSYLGQAIARCQGRRREGLALCREAARRQPLQPENHLNLAATYLLVRNRRSAFEALAKGLAVDPEHPDLLELLERMGARRRPPVRLLARSNPVNRVLGKVTYGWGRKAGAQSAPDDAEWF